MRTPIFRVVVRGSAQFFSRSPCAVNLWTSMPAAHAIIDSLRPTVSSRNGTQRKEVHFGTNERRPGETSGRTENKKISPDRQTNETGSRRRLDLDSPRTASQSAKPNRSPSSRPSGAAASKGAVAGASSRRRGRNTVPRLRAGAVTSRKRNAALHSDSSSRHSIAHTTPTPRQK